MLARTVDHLQPEGFFTPGKVLQSASILPHPLAFVLSSCLDIFSFPQASSECHPQQYRLSCVSKVGPCHPDFQPLQHLAESRA